MRALVGLFLSLVITAALETPARAQEGATDADVLFREARILMDQGDYASACAKLEQSDKLDPGVGTELNLARCYDLARKPASAWRMYQRVIDIAHASGGVAREEAARALQVKLAARLSYARIKSAPGATYIAGLEIRCDGAVIERESWENPLPLDPGAHVIEASAPGREPWRTRIVLERDSQWAELELPVLAPADAPRDPAPVLTSGGRRQRILAASSLGLAAVAAGVGTYFGLRAFSLGATSHEACAGANCDAMRADAYADSRQNGNASNASFIIAGALLATSGVLWFTAPQAPAARSARIVPAVTASSGALVVGGTW